MLDSMGLEGFLVGASFVLLLFVRSELGKLRAEIVRLQESIDRTEELVGNVEEAVVQPDIHA